MRKILAMLLAVVMVLGLCACGGNSAAPAETTAAAGETADASAAQDFAGQTLTISTFSFNAELLQKNVYDPFMEQTGAKLVVETGKNAERVTALPKTEDIKKQMKMTSDVTVDDLTADSTQAE